MTSAASPVVLVELQRSSTTDLAQLLRTAVAAGDVRLVVDLGERKDASSDVLSCFIEQLDAFDASEGAWPSWRNRISSACSTSRFSFRPSPSS